MFPGASIRLFKVFGISIEINISWVIIFALVALALTNSYFPTVFPGHSGFVYLLLGMSTTILFFTSIVLHELSHSYVAVKNGIYIKRITLFIFGGVSEMGGEPPTANIELKMALAGPGMSFVLAFVFGFIAFGLNRAGINGLLAGPFSYLSIINGFLGIFNLLPGFPLDGGRVLRALVWMKTKSLHRSTEIAARSGEGLAAIFVVFGFFLILRGYALNGLWIILIGWFLGQAAVSSLQQMKISEALSDIPVGEIMSREIKKVPADLFVSNLVHDYFLVSKIGRLFVEKNGEIVGLVTLSDAGRVASDKWTQTFVESIMQPVDMIDKVQVSSSAVSATNKIASGVPQLIVYDDNGKIVGILTKTDIIRLLQIRDKLGI